MFRRSCSVVVLLLAGCATSERAAKIEKRLEQLETHGTEVGERLDAMDRREEALRLEVVRLERWQRALRRLEAELAAQKTASGTAVTASATPAPPVKPVFVAAPAYADKNAGAWKDPFKFNVATILGRYYATGNTTEVSKIFESDDNGAPDGPRPMKPRDVGTTGSDDGFVGKALQRTRFLGSAGDTVDVNDLKGKKRVVLVVLRGYDGGVPCVACSGQTLAISQNLDQFDAREAEVYLVYPGKAETVGKFLDNVRALQGGGEPLPVQMLLDVDLAVVKEFKIEGRLAKPTTVILDKSGIVRFAHVGQSKTDRPTIPQMLAVLDRLKREGN